jgi:hypothetical protein
MMDIRRIFFNSFEKTKNGRKTQNQQIKTKFIRSQVV